MNSLESRVENLEALLLPRPDYMPDVYDFLIMAEMSTTARSEEEAVGIYGSKSDWLNDQRID
jgi:hypothetical protein